MKQRKEKGMNQKKKTSREWPNSPICWPQNCEADRLRTTSDIYWKRAWFGADQRQSSFGTLRKTVSPSHSCCNYFSSVHISATTFPNSLKQTAMRQYHGVLLPCHFLVSVVVSELKNYQSVGGMDGQSDGQSRCNSLLSVIEKTKRIKKMDMQMDEGIGDGRVGWE